MKVKGIALILCVSLLLTGCSWLDGSYSSVTAHRGHRPAVKNDAVSATDPMGLANAMKDMISSGASSGVIKVGQYPEDQLEMGIEIALRYVTVAYPVGAYGLERIDHELGVSGGELTLAVTFAYRRTQAELQGIRKVPDMAAAVAEVGNALGRCDASVVMLVEQYKAQDMSQVVEDYAAAYPQIVMETPKVTEIVHGKGEGRVVELSFAYQNSRDDLRAMQDQVEPVFNSAVLYVSGDGSDHQKYSQLYAFLMERFDYKVETSLTPAYSLLHHGVGDSRAFAQVYAAMCRSAGLECVTVTGTCNAEPRTWNLVQEDGKFYHVDLLKCSEIGEYQTLLDEEMEGYVWDYSAYPSSDGEETLEKHEN